jgi:hypothetical protein
MHQIPTRHVRLLAVLALVVGTAGVAFLLIHGSSASSSVSSTTGTQTTSPAPPTESATKQSAKAEKSKNRHNTPVEGVAALDAALVAHPLVVVSVYARTVSTDDEAMQEAKAGAAEVGAGFVAFNVYDEKIARQLSTLLGSGSEANNPEVLIFKRPRNLAFELQGFADSKVVAQAAQNVLPHLEPWVGQANQICARFSTSLGAAQAQVQSGDLATAAGRKQVAAALQRAATLLTQEAQALSGVRTTVGKAKSYAQLVADLRHVSSNMSSEASAIGRNDQTAAQATDQADTRLIATMNTIASDLQLNCAS